MHDDNVSVRAGCVYANARGNSARDFAATCRAVAVTCLSREVHRVMIDATNCEADGISALRDAFTTMVLAGVSSGLRMALVTSERRMQVLFAELQRDLAALQIQARHFDAPGPAAEWLAATPQARETASSAKQRSA